MNERAPLLLAIFALLAIVPASQLARDSREAAPRRDQQTPTRASAPAAPAVSTPAPSPVRPLHLLEEFLGHVAAKAPEAALFASIRTGAEEAGYELEAVVALVPDPRDSHLALNFDQALEAVQRALASSGFLLDRFWLPWSDGEKSPHREVPGMLLFRAPPEPGAAAGGRLVAVLLVGETPKQGIHKAAFLRAVEIAQGMRPAAPVRVLGPTFSGSAESLRLVLRPLPPATPEPTVPPPAEVRLAANVEPRLTVPPTPTFEIVSGSATSPAVAERLTAGTNGAVTFSRTIVSDDVLQCEAFRFLRDRLGWDLGAVALLTESDTAYGQDFVADGSETAAQVASSWQRGVPACRPGDPALDPVRIEFPSGLASIRTAWEREGKLANGDAQGSLRTTAVGPLDLPLAAQSKPVDVVQEATALSPRANDLALSNLLESISRGGIRYVGLLSTDVRDKIFLAERIRLSSLDVVLFSFDNNLLYAHPKHGEAMEGMLVFSSFPLPTEGPVWRDVLGGPEGRYRRQFASEFQQGLYEAARRLLPGNGAETPEPRVWIAAVGNGSLWPLASLPLDGERAGFEDLAGGADLELLLFVLLLATFAYWLRRSAPPSGFRDVRGRPDRQAHLLELAGTGALWLLGSTCLIVGLLPLWAGRARPASTVGFPVLLVLGTVYGALVWTVSRSAGAALAPQLSGRPNRRRNAFLAVVAAVAGTLAVVPLARGLEALWMPGGPEPFYLRASALSSGLSPVLSLALLTTAFVVWVLLELKRRRLAARQGADWPISEPCEPALAGCGRLAEPVERLVRSTFPTARFWIVWAVVILPPALHLFAIIQPIGETRLYGQVFLVLVLAVFSLCAASSATFVALWLRLAPILRRLDEARLRGSFKRLSPAVEWDPMRSFGWQLPPFKMLALSAARLRELSTEERRKEIDRLLAEAYDAEHARDLPREIDARQELRGMFAEAARELAGERSDQAQDFVALRLVAYLRYVAAHMRNSLMAAMASGLLLLAAVRTYSFEPKGFLSTIAWIALLSAVLVTLWVFAEMDRNSTLSTIANTIPGKVTFDRNFMSNLLTYGAVPLLGLVATQFPEVGRLLAGLVNPVLRAVGSG